MKPSPTILYRTSVGMRLIICLTAMIAVNLCSAQGKSAIPSGIAWHGVLTDGLADAKATNRPIMLLSAAPQCAGVPGMW